jgi:protein tyrosine/serine phosphatase
MESARWLLCVGVLAFASSELGCGHESAANKEASIEAVNSTVPIANFAQVTPTLYRGARPSREGLRYLKETLGIRTIVDLEIADHIEASPQAIARERSEVAALGMEFRHEPISAFDPALSAAFDARIERVLTILRDPKQQPVYVHCRHGQDRTGLVIGLERVLVEGWTPESAYREMAAHGFHRFYINLTEYFERKTNSDVDQFHAGADREPRTSRWAMVVPPRTSGPRDE